MQDQKMQENVYVDHLAPEIDIWCDVDDTLIDTHLQKVAGINLSVHNSTCKIDPITFDAIRNLPSQVHFNLVSGRNLPDLLKLAKKLNINNGYLIAGNGAIIYDLNKKEIIKETALPTFYMSSLFKEYETISQDGDNKSEFIAYYNEKIYDSDKNNSHFEYQIYPSKFTKFTAEGVDNLLMFNLCEEKTKYFIDWYEKQKDNYPTVKLIVYGPNLIEFTCGDKLEAVKSVYKFFNHNYVLVDGVNDLNLLNLPDAIKYCPNTANEQVKKVAGMNVSPYMCSVFIRPILEDITKTLNKNKNIEIK